MTEKILYLGDDINTDDIIPSFRTTNPHPEHLKHYVLEHLIGKDTLLNYEAIEAGYNFGCGSSREYAPIAIKAAGIKKVRAYSFADIFYRNSINIGLHLEIIDNPQTNLAIATIINAGGLIAFTQKRLAGEISLPKNWTASRAMTMTEKILAKACDQDYVKPGDIILAKIDLAMSHDAIAAPVFELFHQSFGKNAKLWNPQKVILVADHFIQINDIREDPQAIKLYQQMVDQAKKHDCQLFDLVAPNEAEGICHLLLPEKGLILPGMVIAGTDSHSCTYGAFGNFALGVGTTDMANIFATGDLWIRVPATILMELTGKLPQYISAKDIMLFILGKIGCQGAAGKVIEFRGSVIDQLSMDERMTLSNMAVECGAICGLFTPDKITYQYLNKRTQQQLNPIKGDENAEYEKIYHFDLSKLEPQIACPPKPDQVVNISQLAETKINIAFIGSCTGGKLTDLAEAASVLKNRHIATNVRMYIVPASQEVRHQAEQLGYLDIFSKAGAQILKTACGACINSGKGTLDKNETGIYATNRNFMGRNGDATGKSYLASPRIVALSAIAGKISQNF